MKNDYPGSSWVTDGLIKQVGGLHVMGAKLPDRVQNALMRAGVLTLGQALRMARLGWLEQIQGLGVLGIEAIEQCSIELAAELADPSAASDLTGSRTGVPADGDTHAPPKAKAPPLSGTPVMEDLPEGPVDPLALLPRFLERAFTTRPRDARILTKLYALDGDGPFTLEAVGDAYSLSRERVRQLRGRAEMEIGNLLTGGTVAGRCAPPRLVQTLRDLVEALPPVNTESAVRSTAEGWLGRPLSPIDQNRMVFLLSMLGFTSRRGETISLRVIEDRVWRSPAARPWEQLIALFEVLHEALSASRDWCSVFELTARVNRIGRHEWTEAEVEGVLDSLPHLEMKDARVRMAFPFLSTFADKAYRVLQEEGEPLHFREIQRRIGMLEGRTARRRSALRGAHTNSLSNHPDFVSLGRSGQWKLSSWNHVAEGTLADLIAEELAVRGVLTRIEDIVPEVQARGRDATAESLTAIISHYPDRFARGAGGTVGLTAWGLKGQRRRSRREVHEQVRGALLQLATRSGEVGAPTLTGVLDHVAASTGLSRESARRRLASGEWFDLPETRQDRIVLDPERIRSVPEHVHTSPVTDAIGGEVREFLRRQTGHTAPLKDVVRHVCRTKGVKYPSVYPVIGRMDDVVKEEGMVRLVP